MCDPVSIGVGVTGLVGAGSSIYSAKKAGDAADQAGDIAAAQLQFSRDLWSEYKTKFGPVEDKLIEMADVDAEQYASQAGGDVSQATEKAKQSTARTISRYGLNPNSGRFADAMTQLDIAGSAQSAGAKTRARQQAEDVNFNRKTAVVGLGKGLPAQAVSAGANAGAMYTNIAGMYGQQAGDLAAATASLPWQKLTRSPSSPGPMGPPNAGEQGVPGWADGGLVVGPGDGKSDSVPAVVDGQMPARLSTGEFVVPAEVVQTMGPEFFQDLVNEVRSAGLLPHDKARAATEHIADEDLVPGARKTKALRDKSANAMAELGI